MHSCNQLWEEAGVSMSRSNYYAKTYSTIAKDVYFETQNSARLEGVVYPCNWYLCALIPSRCGGGGSGTPCSQLLRSRVQSY